MKLKYLYLCCVFAFFSTSCLHAVQQTEGSGSNKYQGEDHIEGQVYEDLNGNGRQDEGESGIAGVMVSNQREVVTTDEEGHYALPIEEGMIAFVSKPAGYEFAKNGYNLPQFYYIHQPEGSPELRFPGVEPTGNIPETVAFGLVPTEKKESFKAIIFGDPQPRNSEDLSFYRDDVVSELADNEAVLTLVLGDIMFNDLSMYERYNRMMKTLDTPVFNIFGNHDINFKAENNKTSKETFKSHYGPTYYSFEYGDVHFMALDNIDYLGRDNEEGPYRGFLTENQLQWAENNLEHVDEDKLVVLMSHIPLYSDNGKGAFKNTVNREKLLDLVEGRDRVIYLSAHRHRIFHDFLGKEEVGRDADPIHHVALTAASGAWWDGPKDHNGIPITYQRDGVPNGYHIFDFDKNTYKEHYKGAGHSVGFQMRIEQPSSSLTLEEYQESPLLVNVFNGNQKSEVRFQINDEGEWHEMERLEKHYSPYFDRVMDGYRTPGHSPHFWRAELPELEQGIHKIQVVTEDMYGREYSQAKVIEIE